MILGQAAPAGATPTVLYEVPRGTAYAWLCALFVCSRSPNTTSFRVSVGPALVGDPEEYIYYDVPIIANDTVLLMSEAMDKSSLKLRVGDQVVVESSTGELSFTLFGEAV